jgi:signal transduction histidine kinase
MTTEMKPPAVVEPDVATVLATLEAERSEARADRQRTSRFHHEMLGIVGHDLRAPLGAILIVTEMLALDNTRDANAVMQIVSFAKRMTRIVDQVLDLTRLRLGGGIPLALCQTRLLPILESAIGRLAASSPATQVALTLEVDARGLWDMDRLAQVISSVLDNAVQHGRDAGAVTVGVSRSDGVTTISIHNELRDGPITPEVLAMVFEPSLSTGHVGLGWGLGLQISSAIMRGHGGTIAIKSSAAGTCVEIALPDASA